MKREKKTMDGNQAAAHVAYAFSDVAAIYPITPSSAMAEVTDEWSVEGRKNIFDRQVLVKEMQSEIGAAGAVHGALAAGALAVTYTASQGLLLMIPNLYKIAGEQLPGVFHVAARTIATHALSIFGDHSDIYACRQTGVAMLSTSSVQEVMDLAPVAHLAAVQGKLPFLHFFDGFRTSHEMQKIEVWTYEDLKEMSDKEAIDAFRKKALHPDRGMVMGAAQNPDIFFQTREASNTIYNAMPSVVEGVMEQINERLGTSYGLFDYIGPEDPEQIIVAMGSVCQTIEETITHLSARGDCKAGLVKVHLYRPFCKERFLEAIPDSVKKITVLDRTKEPGAVGEPLFLDVVAALKDSRFGDIPVFSGRYGLSSKDTTPGQIAAVLSNDEKRVFTIGIEDDVTYLSLKEEDSIMTEPEGCVNCKFWGFGGDGTVSANKNSIKIIGNHTDLSVQAYFEYDSKKSRGLTVSHLRFSPQPIRSAYMVNRADFVACHNPTYIRKYDMVQELKDGGKFLLNCSWDEKTCRENIPGQVRAYMADHNIRLFVVDGMKIGKETQLNGKINTILQAAFFAVADIIPIQEAERLMKEAAAISYRKKGDKIVQMNWRAIEEGIKRVVEIPVPKEWKDAAYVPLEEEMLPDRKEVTEYVKAIQHPVTRQQGNQLPVSSFLPYQNGATPSGTTAHERRNVAEDVPVWKPENCIQCNRCSYVCPHAVIRPVTMNAQEAKEKPEGMKTLPMTAMEGYEFAITPSYVDCTGCGSCVAVCPGKMGEKALVMQPTLVEADQGLENLLMKRQAEFDFGKSLLNKPEVLKKFKVNTVKGSQFKRPLLEFSGACAGCGETPYAKLVTQLFGENMYIANATGCSSIWGNSSPAASYAADDLGRGPAWSNSLFEDGAEFGYGMLLARKAVGDTEQKKSIWVFGGDGWAYDIGFGGVDHVLASGENINMLIFDTEVYSNTGGQASKATPTGSIAKFTAGGKKMKKKDLAGMMMSYGYVYVAQIAMGADYNQTVKALAEAEAYEGPSLIIAYSPCISHGIRAGMGTTPWEEKKAVESGYWHLFRYNPVLWEKGEPAFILDSKEPTLSYEEFLEGEIRYDALKRTHPGKAEELFAKAAKQAKERYAYLKKLEALYRN